MTSSEHDRTPTRSIRPSAPLLGAALTGLLGAAGAVSACDGDNTADPDPDQLDAAACPEPPDAAPPPDAPEPDAPPPDAGTPDATPSKIISETPGNRTFASLKAECDTRNGYIQIHASCAGVNYCAGFSYGDWDPGVLTEHTCAGVNGCNGLSCVVLPPDGGKTGAQILEADLPEDGPRSCKNCHADWLETGPDTTKFKVWVLPGSGRTLANWLDLPAAAQERTVAFGKIGLLPDGTAYSHMAAYHKIYSRAEIERVVAYVRSGAVTPVVVEVKIADPAP